MKVTFWGTRGSLPAPLSGRSVRAKIVNALVRAGEAQADLSSPAKVETF